MITRLSLESFGRFRRTVFDLSPITVLYGPNEAGKTTFFDGLFQALCRPPESKKAGRLLKERYGPGRKAEAVFSDGDSGPLSDDEFLNLYAIRAGDLKLAVNQGSDWLERLKARLFLGGVDPSALAAEFEKRASDSRTLLHNKELDRALENAAKADQDLESHRRERDSLLVRESALGEVEARLREIRSLRKAAQEEEREAEAELAREEKSALKRSLSDQLARLEEWENAEAEILDPESCGEGSREEWDRLTEAGRLASAAVQAERGRLHALKETADRAYAEWRALREARDGVDVLSSAAMRLASEARDSTVRKTSLTLGMPGWSMVLALTFAAAGIACLLLLEGVSAVAMAALAFLSAGAALIRGRRDFRKGERARASRALAQWKARWTQEAQGIRGDPGTKGVEEIDSAEEFVRYLEAWEADRKGLEARETEARGRHEATAAAVEDSVAALEALREEESLRRGFEQSWLAGHGAASPEEFLIRHSRRRRLLSELPLRRRELEAAAPGGDLAAYRRDLLSRLRVLDDDGISARAADEAGMQRLRLRRRELLARIEDLGTKERETIADREGMAGEIRGALGKMAAAIVACEERLAAAGSRIKAMELDKKAAAMATEIFRELGEGTDSLLEELALEIGSMLARIIPRENPLSISAPDGLRIQAMDAGRSIRSLDHLSTGTRDAVVLAARLALALKHRGRAGILALDEPFLAMDEDRETGALLLLQDFHARHGWQIILLTKDARLRDKAMSLFDSPYLVDLRDCA